MYFNVLEYFAFVSRNKIASVSPDRLLSLCAIKEQWEKHEEYSIRWSSSVKRRYLYKRFAMVIQPGNQENMPLNEWIAQLKGNKRIFTEKHIKEICENLVIVISRIILLRWETTTIIVVNLPDHADQIKLLFYKSLVINIVGPIEWRWKTESATGNRFMVICVGF